MHIIDDLLLLDVLSAAASPDLRAAVERGEVHTTFSWYCRLGRAVTAGSGKGSLSRRFDRLDPQVRTRVDAFLDDLPEEVGLLSPRVVVPVMRALTTTRNLNVLGAEAVAAALVLDASVLVSTHAPLISDAADDLHLEYDVVDVG